LEKDNVYTFRTIIDYYYRYRNDLEEDNDFVSFIERAIGKVKVPEEYRDVATPEFLYLSNVKRLHNELVKMDKMCEFYEDTLKDIEKDCLAMGLLRCHRGYMVNVENVKLMRKERGNLLLEINHTPKIIPVSKRYASDVINFFSTNNASAPLSGPIPVL
jgi:DNA-binding LytR/AlgR family response regulator